MWYIIVLIIGIILGFLGTIYLISWYLIRLYTKDPQKLKDFLTKCEDKVIELVNKNKN